MNTEELTNKNIYDLKLIFKASKLSKPIEFGKMIFFIIENNEITNINIITRDEFEGYKPKENEYYLSRLRDTGWIEEDYILSPIELLKKAWKFEI